VLISVVMDVGSKPPTSAQHRGGVGDVGGLALLSGCQCLPH
jgi:hypothetical protein